MINYPITISLTHQAILVVGGGAIATRKVLGLLNQGAEITVVAPRITLDLATIPGIILLNRGYRSEDSLNKFMVFICTDDPEINRRAVEDCSSNQLVNDCTNKERSTFYNMAITEQQGIQVAISSKGVDPSYVKDIKSKIEQLIQAETEYKRKTENR